MPDDPTRPSASRWTLWTSELSPFGLKVRFLLRCAGVPFRMLPGEGGRIENARFAWRRKRLVEGKLPLTWPEMTADDEFPAVPFLFGPGGENLYDSSAIAHWLDRDLPADRRFTPGDPAARFVTRLVDDYADEFGLYIVHHYRWKVSAIDNDAGKRVAREFAFLFPGPLRSGFAAWFGRRQVRRLVYLFSVAPPGFRIEDLPAALQPPAPEGFPPTHELLESAFERLLGILEKLLSGRSFLFGERPTLADAAIGGQLTMNLSDPSANAIIRNRAPRLHEWLDRFDRGDRDLVGRNGPVDVDEALRPLLAEIARTHVPLMRQNEAAVRAARKTGETVFNEEAFVRGEGLYTGVIDGHPFRAFRKTFQARVWRDCVAAWLELPDDARERVTALLPDGTDISVA